MARLQNIYGKARWKGGWIEPPARNRTPLIEKLVERGGTVAVRLRSDIPEAVSATHEGYEALKAFNNSGRKEVKIPVHVQHHRWGQKMSYATIREGEVTVLDVTQAALAVNSKPWRLFVEEAIDTSRRHAQPLDVALPPGKHSVAQAQRMEIEALREQNQALLEDRAKSEARLAALERKLSALPDAAPAPAEEVDDTPPPPGGSRK